MFLVRIHLLPFGKVWLGCVCWPPCATPGNEAERRINGGWVSSGSILSRLWTKFMKFWDNVQDILSYFPMSLPDCLCRVSVRRYSPSSLEVVEKRKPNKCKTILAMIFWEGRPWLFYGGLLARFTVHHLTKFGWVPFVDLRLQSLAMKYSKRNAEFTETFQF